MKAWTIISVGICLSLSACQSMQRQNPPANPGIYNTSNNTSELTRAIAETSVSDFVLPASLRNDKGVLYIVSLPGDRNTPHFLREHPALPQTVKIQLQSRGQKTSTTLATIQAKPNFYGKNYQAELGLGVGYRAFYLAPGKYTIIANSANQIEPTKIKLNIKGYDETALGVLVYRNKQEKTVHDFIPLKLYEAAYYMHASANTIHPTITVGHGYKERLENLPIFVGMTARKKQIDKAIAKSRRNQHALGIMERVRLIS